MNKIFDYKVKKIHLWEKFLLLFVKPSYIIDSNGNIKCKIGYKLLFDKTYITDKNISIKKCKEIK